MKKSIKYVLILLAVTSVMQSCMDDFLTVEPLSNITNENFWKSEKDARAGLNAAYTFIQKAYITGFLVWGEARSDDFLGNVSGGSPMQNVTLNRLNSTMSACNWDNWYKVVSIANYAIYYIPFMEGNINETTQNHLLSEAYFLRAFAYFSMYRIWGDVPLVTEPVLKVTDVTKPTQTGKDTIFALVISDLEKADSLVDITVEELYLYSCGALYALTTDVAMWQKDYEKAVQYAEKLIAINRYNLENAPFEDVCRLANTSDNIWTLDWDYTISGENTICSGLANSSSSLIPTYEIYQKWFAWEKEWGVCDIRRQCTIDSIKVRNYTSRHVSKLPAACQIWKWSPGEHLAQSDYRDCPIPMYRYADILLLYAEALNRLGRMEEALAPMNEVRKRAGLPAKDMAYYSGDKNKLEEDIWQERQFELYGEGRRWFDLMRTDRVETVMNAFFNGYITQYGGKDFNLFTEEWNKYWPVSQTILNENQNLHQIGSY